MYALLLILILVFIIAFSSIRIIKQSTVGIVMRLGKFNRRAETGVNFIIPFVETIYRRVDLREVVIDFPPQPVITKDNVTMQIDTVVYYKITDPVYYTFEIANPISAIENLTATTLRNIIGELDLDETLTSRDIINSKLRIILDEATDKWGIKVNRVELKNILPPKDIQEAMEKQMRAERQRRESVLTAEGQKKSAILTQAFIFLQSVPYPDIVHQTHMSAILFIQSCSSFHNNCIVLIFLYQCKLILVITSGIQRIQ